MKKSKKKKSPKKRAPTAITSSVIRQKVHEVWNFVNEAGPGCHIARPECPASTWVLQWESINPTEYEGMEIPDIAVDPEDEEMVLCNVRPEYVVSYITVYDRVLRGRQGQILTTGITTSDTGESRSCATLIVLCPPHTFCHLCSIEFPPGTELQELLIDSDIQVWNQHPNPDDYHSQTIGFPLQGGPFLCTQGVGGQLTHFFSGNLHAIDFRCPIGTPLLAVGDGVVVQVKAEHSLTGVAVSNLFEWNSILIQLDERSNSRDGPLFVEYVHIASASVQQGERVTCGQIIGTSGSVGFSPEPHLHFAAYRSAEPTAPTVRVHFQCQDTKETFLPIAGQFYDATGRVEEFAMS